MNRRKTTINNVETVETRTLLAASLSGGVLTIQGTAGNDKVVVNADDDRTLVQLNRERWEFSTSAVDSLQIETFDGNDKVLLGDDVTVPANIDTGNGNDRVVGGEGDDTIATGDGKDKIVALGGNDDINSGSGTDKIVSGAGNDTIDGGAGSDKISAGAGHDEILGGSGHDKIAGGSGRDDIRGGDGNDKMSGGDGSDSLVGGLGVDAMSGGNGLDLADYDEEDRAASAFFVDFELELETEMQPTNGPSGASGDARFEVEQEGSEYEVEFEIDISDARARTLYDVYVDDVFIGQLLTDGSGWGAIELSNDPDEVGEQLFDSEISFSPGALVTVRNHETRDVEMQGTFRDSNL